MFLAKAKERAEALKATSVVPASEINWDHDDATNWDTGHVMEPEHFTWYQGDFHLEDLGDAEFLDYDLPSFIAREMDLDVEQNAHDSEWREIWESLKEGGNIHTPVHIALAYQPHYEGHRIFIVDGWHRISMYLSAGRKVIPAIIGVPIKEHKNDEIKK